MPQGVVYRRPMGAGFPTVVMGLLIGTVYFLPSLLAWRRQHPWRQKIMLANLVVGWTVIGWAVCMGLALSRPKGDAP
ncbi:superinfection immunity protein [Ferrovibrio terrae]|uniref:superinfection immunity protein n=1 Tax=Ferrovibrio terrae TaxID=2594003 RepID=UPI0031380092